MIIVAMWSRHVYLPLDPHQIRTLLLHSGQDDDQLVATFEHRPMTSRSFDERYERCDTTQRDNLPPEALRSTDGYEAISYCWGSSERSRTLHIDGGGELGITESLFGALQRFRYSTKSRRLWADAVCINQEDSEEKAAQVAAMHLVYTGADMVLIWLGPETPQDALAFSVMHLYDIRTVSVLKLSDDDILIDLDKKLQSASSCLCCGCTFSTSMPRTAKASLSALADLLTRPWFFRMWVVQEVDHRATIGRIFSGRHSVPLIDFIMAIYFLSDCLIANRLDVNQKAGRKTRDTISQVVHEYGGREPTTQSFWNSFNSFSKRLCSDPRDRVYAIRSCLGLEHLEALKPNYVISDRECFRRLTLIMLQESNFPEIGSGRYTTPNSRFRVPWIPLLLVGTEDSVPDPAGLSWVPDLHNLSGRSRDKLAAASVAFSFDRELYRSNHERFECKVDPEDERRIQIRGQFFATLSSPSFATVWPAVDVDDFATAENDLAINEHILKWYRACRDVALPALAGADDAAAIFHDLLICRTELVGRSAINHEHVLAKFLETWPTDQRSAVRPSLEMFLSHYDRSYLDRGRILCIIDGPGIADVAWVPKTSRVGDQICVIGGTPFPLVVRPCEDGSFRLLGDAFPAAATLDQALGCKRGFSGARPSSADESMSWQVASPEMVALMDELGWITLS